MAKNVLKTISLHDFFLGLSQLFPESMTNNSCIDFVGKVVVWKWMSGYLFGYLERDKENQSNTTNLRRKDLIGLEVIDSFNKRKEMKDHMSRRHLCLSIKWICKKHQLRTLNNTIFPVRMNQRSRDFI